MKKILQILFSIIGFILLERACYQATGGFNLQKTYCDTSLQTHQLAGDTSWGDEKLKKRLDQPFFFLGKGVQCYAFIGQDGETVIKLFKQYHAGLPSDVLRESWLPSNLKDQILTKRQERMAHILQSATIAFEYLRDETALLAAHLYPTKNCLPTIELHDKLGIVHSLELDNASFVVQKKADAFYPTLLDLAAQGNLEAVKQVISNTLTLIAHRCDRGIGNSDPVIRKNFALIGLQPVEIDIGSFTKNQHLSHPHQKRRELFFETLELKAWITDHLPELSPYFHERVQATLTSPFTEPTNR